MKSAANARTFGVTACLAAALLAVQLLASGCQRKMYDPDWAAEPYPSRLHASNTTSQMQVLRRGTHIDIINATARSYRAFVLWINQRYMHRVEALPAGETITLSLWDFHDEYGDRFNAGGFFREYEPTPVRLVQIQLAHDQPLIGLVTIPSEEVTVKPEPGR